MEIINFSDWNKQVQEQSTSPRCPTPGELIEEFSSTRLYEHEPSVVEKAWCLCMRTCPHVLGNPLVYKECICGCVYCSERQANCTGVDLGVSVEQVNAAYREFYTHNG